MSSTIDKNNTRIARNTVFLYLRLAIVMIVNLYTTRIVLEVLGVSDYGIYNVVCGFVSMFGVLNTSMSNGVQRFYNYELGRNGESALINITFKSNLRDCKIGCLSAIYDTNKVGKVYLPLIRKRQDWGLWIKVLKICKEAKGYKEPLAIYRLREGSISNKKMDLIKYNIGVYQEVLGWSKLRATLYFFFAFMPAYVKKKFIVRLYNK